MIWNNLEFDDHYVGSKILSIEYAAGDPADTLVDAGNDTGPFRLEEVDAPGHFLSGNILAGAKRERLTIHKRVRLTAAGGAVALRAA